MTASHRKGNPRWPWVRRAVRREQDRQSQAMAAYWRDEARFRSAAPVTEDCREGPRS